MPSPQVPPQKGKTCLSVHSMLTFIVALLALNAIGFLFLSIQFSTKQSVIVFAPNSVESKLDALSAKLAAFQSQVNPPSGQQGSIQANGDVYTGWDLKFSPPDGFSVALYEDGFVEGQQNVRITSQEGSLFLPGGGPGKPGPNDFISGYEMTISKLDRRQDPVGDSSLVKTMNPMVRRIDFMCDGVGCPQEKYLVTTAKSRYLILVNASNDYPRTVAMTSAIISTITE